MSDSTVRDPAGGPPQARPSSSPGPLAWSESIGPVLWAGTERLGGVSNAPYESLNLGGRVGDDPAAVTENRRRLAVAVGVDPDRLVLMAQVHGCDVAAVSERPAAAPQVDALVTAEPGLALVALGADCAPVVLADPGAGVVAAVHAGRQGLRLGVLPAAVAAMRDLGAVHIVAWVGPTICGRCYEVPAAMQADLATVVPAAVTTTRWGTPGIDNGVGAMAVLRDLGVTASRVGGCTYERPELFSYRRDGVTGRHGTVVVLS